MDEILALVDEWLTRVGSRDMFTAAEVGDLLLDIRVAATREPTEPELVA